MPYTQNPDMVAMTIGRIVLDRLNQGKTASIEDILSDLQNIVSLGQKGRISEQMAKGALAVMGRPDNLGTLPTKPRLTANKLAAR